MLVYGFLLFVTLTCLLLLMQALWGREIYNHYRGSRAVTCPETHRQVAVSFDAFHAALTGLRGKCNLRLAECTLWPARIRCGQECIPAARRTAAYTQGQVEVRKTKKIYHVPVLLAAFAAWVFGAAWHSQYLFRTRWKETFGLSRPELRQMVWWWSPHLLSVVVCLLFAYGVAWQLAFRGRRGVWAGIIASISLWAAVAAAGWIFTGWTGIPGDVLQIEISYTFLASVAVGAIVGGLSGKLIAPAV
ncbi:MAG: DUF1761 domain-containing protein [Acidobacteriia bacterium]|nr:DUF1761 domain-containing protein [Terriglobia bacterium]